MTDEKSFIRRIPGFRSGTWWKMGLAVLGYGFIILLIIGLLVPGESSDSSISTLHSREYQIAKSEDVSIKALDKSLSMYSASEIVKLPMNIRMTYRVIVPSDITKEELEATFKQIVKDQTKTNPDIDEITIYAYDRMDDINGVYTFGMCEWCPNGEWSGVTSKIAQTNDRSNYEFVFDIRDKVGNLDTINVPSDKEFEIYNAYEKALWSDPDLDEDRVNDKISKEFGITVKELLDIYSKVMAYKYR